MSEDKFLEGRNVVLEAFRSGKTIDKLYILNGCKDGPVQTFLCHKVYNRILLFRLSQDCLHRPVLAAV